VGGGGVGCWGVRGGLARGLGGVGWVGGGGGGVGGEGFGGGWGLFFLRFCWTFLFTLKLTCPGVYVCPILRLPPPFRACWILRAAPDSPDSKSHMVAQDFFYPSAL